MGLLRPGRPGLLGMAARTAVVAGTASAVAGRVSHHQQQKYTQQEQEQYAQQAQYQQQAAPAQVEPEYMGELQQLAQLKSQGVITDAEFNAKKKQILGL